MANNLALADPSEDSKLAQIGKKLKAQCPFAELLNSDGAVEWKQDNTCMAKCCGRNRRLYWTQTYYHLYTRVLWYIMLAASMVFIILGMLQIVSMGVFLTFMSYTIWHVMIDAFTFADLQIVRHLCFSINNGITLLLILLAGVSMGMMCEWDYRGIATTVQYVAGAFSIFTDAQPLKERSAVRISTIIGIIPLLLGLTLMNLGKFPGLNYAVPFFVVPDIGVPITALSIYNQAVLGYSTLAARKAYLYSGDTLHGAYITLKGADEVEASTRASTASDHPSVVVVVSDKECELVLEESISSDHSSVSGVNESSPQASNSTRPSLSGVNESAPQASQESRTRARSSVLGDESTELGKKDETWFC